MRMQSAHPSSTAPLPAQVVAAYAAKGVKELYRWQSAAVQQGAAGGNLVYCAPTSGGKSIVAEVLMLRRLWAVERGRRSGLLRPPPPPAPGRPPAPPRALVVLPYLSVVAEKAADIGALVAGLRWRVQGYLGERDDEGTPLAGRVRGLSLFLRAHGARVCF